MYRGTTPTLTFTVPFDCSTITACSVAFAQNDVVVLEKKIGDCHLEGNVITVPLTEEDTLVFDCKKRALDIQLRIGCGAERFASQIIHTHVDKILKDGCLE